MTCCLPTDNPSTLRVGIKEKIKETSCIFQLVTMKSDGLS